jgi:acyl-CoA synthetase
LWRDETFYDRLVRHVRARPHAIASGDGERRLTWEGVRHWVNGVAIELRAYGLIGADRIPIWMSNRVKAIVSFLACSREGEAVDGHP